MTLLINVLGWIGAAVLLSAYWLVSTQRASGTSRRYQGMNLLGALLVLANSLYHGAHPSVGVNAFWIAIGLYTLAAAPFRASPSSMERQHHRRHDRPMDSAPRA